MTTQIVKNWTFRASWAKVSFHEILTFFRQVKVLTIILSGNSVNFTVIYFCKTRTKLQENWFFYFCQKLTFSVQISMISGRFMVKTWHFHEKIFHFESNFWQKSVKLLHWPKNEHLCISILLTSLEQILHYRNKICSIDLFLLAFLHISVDSFISIIYWNKSNLQVCSRLMYWYSYILFTLEQIYKKLYINISFKVFKVNLYKKSSL